MDALIRKLQAASGGSDELDFEIAEELDRLGVKYATTIEGHTPQWSQSIDAALTLVPDHPLSPWESIRFERHREGVGCFLDGADAFAATPALALCIVALRAREEEGKR